MPPIFAASLVVLLEVISFGAIFPVLPDYTQQLGGGPMWVGLLFAFVALPRVVTNTLWGRLSDRWGRKRTLALITVGTLSGSLMWGLAPTLGGWAMGGFLWLAVSRILAGVFQAQAALTQAIAADVTAPNRRAGAMGILGAAFGLGMVIGIAMGGYVGERVGFEAVGWCSAAAQLASLGVIMLFLRETHPAHTARAETAAMPAPQKLTALLVNPVIYRLLAIWLVATVGQMVMVPTLRMITQDRYGYDLTDTTLLFLLWAMIGVAVQGGLVRVMSGRVGDARTLLVGLVLLAAGLATIGVTNDEAWFWIGMVGVSVGAGLTTPTVAALLSCSVDAGDQGSVQGLNQSVTALGRGISYVAAGLLYAHFAPGITYLFGGILCGIAAVMLYAATRTGAVAAATRGA